MSRSYSITWSIGPIANGVVRQMQFNDIYDVKVYPIRTDYKNILGQITEQKFGTGWGGKYKYRHVYANPVDA